MLPFILATGSVIRFHGIVLNNNRVKGGDLFRRLSDKGAFSEEVGKKLFKQLLEGVEYLHSHSVTHRDLKVC